MPRRPKTDEVWMRPKEHGAALKRKRLRAGYSQRELGLLAKCSHATIGYLERGVGAAGAAATVGDALAARIAKRLNVDVEDLFEDVPSSRSSTLATAARSSGHSQSGVRGGQQHRRSA